MNRRRRRMVAVPRAWDTLELMSPEYVTRDFGGAFFPAPSLPPFVRPSVARSFAGSLPSFISPGILESSFQRLSRRVPDSLCVSHKNRHQPIDVGEVQRRTRV